MSRILCVAVLITHHHAILPAQCVTDKIDSITFKNDQGNEVTYELEEVAIHPDYALLKDSDIAIGKFKREMTQVRPICMPRARKDHYYGQRLDLAGVTRQQSSLRIKGQAHIATPEFRLGSFIDVNHVSSNHICGYLFNNFLTGSALMGISVIDSNPVTLKFYVIGILVFGKFVEDITKANRVFVDIFPYKDWISRNTIE